MELEIENQTDIEGLIYLLKAKKVDKSFGGKKRSITFALCLKEMITQRLLERRKKVIKDMGA